MTKMQKSEPVKAIVVECKEVETQKKKRYSIVYEIDDNGNKKTQEIIQDYEQSCGEILPCFLVEDKLSPTGFKLLPVEKLSEYQSPRKNILLIFSIIVFVLSLFFAINTIYLGFANIAFKLLTPISSLIMFAILLHNIQAILDNRTMVLGPNTVALDAVIIGNERRLQVDTGKFLYHPIYEYDYKDKNLNYVDKNGFPSRQQKGKHVILYYSPVRKQFIVQQSIKENIIAACISGITGLILIVVFLVLLFV